MGSNVQLKEVTLTNFRSYKGVHTFRPSIGSTFILGVNSDSGYSSNGGGKTSLLSSIAWGLYGELATGSSKDMVIFYTENEVSVEIKFEGLIVRRSKKRNKAEFLEFFSDDFGGWIREDLAQTQEKLDKYLGVSKELFYNAFWLDNASKTVQFLMKKPSERLSILQDLLGEGFFYSAKKSAYSKRVFYEKELEKLEVLIKTTETQIDQLKTKIYDHEVDYLSYKEQVDSNEKTKSKKISSLQEEVESKKFILELEESNYYQKQNNNPIILDDVIKNCAILEVQIKQQEEQYSKINTSNTKKICTTCKRSISVQDKTELELEKKRLYKEIVRLQSLLTTEKKKKEKLLKEKKELDKLYLNIRDIKISIKILESDLTKLIESDHSLSMEMLKKIKENIEKEKTQLNSLKNKLLSELENKDYLSKLLPRYRFWEEGFGSKGIQNLLLDDVRGLLSQFTRNYLSNFSGEVLKVVYPKSDKGFEIITSYRDKETSTSNLSRGELSRANMSVLLALRRVLLYMCKSKIDFIVLDDAVSDLDESGTQSIVDLSETLSKEVCNVFVTVPQHLPTIKPTQIVRVEKKDGVSCIRT